MSQGRFLHCRLSGCPLFDMTAIRHDMIGHPYDSAYSMNCIPSDWQGKSLLKNRRRVSMRQVDPKLSWFEFKLDGLALSLKLHWNRLGGFIQALFGCIEVIAIKDLLAVVFHECVSDFHPQTIRLRAGQDAHNL